MSDVAVDVVPVWEASDGDIGAWWRASSVLPVVRQAMSDPRWVEAHGELLALHARKSATYGTEGEPFKNFVEIGLATGKVPERYVWERILEKAIRSLNMIDSGLAADVKEGPDVSSLALCAEALRRRRV